MHHSVAMHTSPPYCIRFVTRLACPRFVVVLSLECFNSLPTVIRTVVLDRSTSVASSWPSSSAIVVFAHSYPPLPSGTSAVWQSQCM